MGRWGDGVMGGSCVMGMSKGRKGGMSEVCILVK